MKVEWDLAVGVAGGQATERLARREVALVDGEPRVVAALVAVPATYARARLVAVVRMLGPGTSHTVARRLADSRLEVTPHLRRIEAR